MKNVIKIFLIICLLVLWVGTAFGIDKTKKSGSSPRPVERKSSSQNDVKKDSQIQQDNKSSQKDQKTHDDFIDKNNNGIDDRAEKSTVSGKAKKESPEDKKVETKKK